MPNLSDAQTSVAERAAALEAAMARLGEPVAEENRPGASGTNRVSSATRAAEIPIGA